MSHTAHPASTEPTLLAERSIAALSDEDPDLYRLLAANQQAQSTSLSLVATAGIAPPAVLAAAGSAIANLAVHGYPGLRLEAGSDALDAIEQLAVQRAKALFAASYVDVQPLSGSNANRCAYTALLRPGDTILCLDPAWGGLSAHGAPTAATSREYRVISYGLNGLGRIDYDHIAALAGRDRPALIVCAAGASPRIPDYAKLRAVADSVDAYLLADVSGIAGLVAGGALPNPVDHAHVTTCDLSTFGSLCGGLVLSGSDADSPGPGGHRPLRAALRNALFPATQTTASAASIAATAAALRHMSTAEYAELAHRSVANAAALATLLVADNHDVLSHGTDGHSLLLNVASDGLTGLVAERALEKCGVLVSRARIPFDVKPPRVASQIRLGTTVITQRGMGPRNMRACADLIAGVLRAVEPRSDTDFVLPEQVRRDVQDAVATICRQFPLYRADSHRPHLARVA